MFDFVFVLQSKEFFKMSKFVLFLSVFVLAFSVLFVVEDLKPYRNRVIKFLDKVGLSCVNEYIEKLKEMTGLVFKEKLLTKEELAKFKESPIYLAILGKVYDVTKGKRHYGKGGGYEGFSGRDGTRAFITGDFTEAGLVEDIRGLTLPEFLGLHEWQQKYDKDYTYIGKVIGEFYDEKGQPTETLNTFNHHLKEAFAEKDLDALDMTLFPPCNSEWNQASGKRIWCTEWSGGIRRSWVGLPREYLRAGKTQPRCACVKDKGPPSSQPDSKNHKNNGDLDNPSLKVYSGCDPKAVSCSFPR